MRYSIKAMLGLICFVALAIVAVRSMFVPSLLPDIEERIHADFEVQDRAEVRALLFGLTDVANSARVQRCILYLANGDLEELSRASELASVDCDSLFEQAERDATGTRVMNFHRTFEQAPEIPPK